MFSPRIAEHGLPMSAGPPDTLVGRSFCDRSKADHGRELRQEQTVALAAFTLLLQAYTDSPDVTFLYGDSSAARLSLFECNISVEHHQSVARFLRTVQDGVGPTKQDSFQIPSMIVYEDEAGPLPTGLDLKFALVLAFSSSSHSGRAAERCLHHDGSIASHRSGQQILSQFVHIRQQILAGLWDLSSTTLGTLNILSQDDFERIRAWNSVAPKQDWRTIHGRAADWLNETPGPIAVCAWDGQLTRLQLETASDSLAGYLTDHACGPGDVVAVIIAKSVWVPVALLAVMKTGAAFTLLDQELPLKRLKAMISTVSCSFALSSKSNVSLATQLVQTVVAMEEKTGRPILVKDAREIRSPRLSTLTSPDDVAFINFTSGSTGKPKAVMTTHSAWCSGLRADTIFPAKPGSRCLHRTSYNFAVSCLELLAPLMNGGVLCIPNSNELTHGLEGAIRRLRPDWVALPPSLAKSLDPCRLPSVKSVFMPGEPCSIALQKTWAKSPIKRIEILYGSTEGGHVSLRMVSSASLDCQNIGKGISKRTWIVDPVNHNRLMPIGAVGELVLEGYSIAQGYAQGPPNTSQPFIDSPAWASSFDADPDGRRWYKTGDLVKYNQHGELLLLGRKDYQIKLHGQRIEPVEVEDAIVEALDGEVQDVIVELTFAARDPEKPRLTAFVILNSSGSKSGCVADLERRLRASLFQRLPSFMVPTKVVVLKAFPTTTSGKVDRRKLRDFEPASKVGPKPSLSDGCIRTQDGLQYRNFCKLRKAWSEVLQTTEDNISPASNWIDLGGDSASADLLSRKAREAGFDIGLPDILRYPSMEEMLGSPTLSRPDGVTDPDDILTRANERSWHRTTSFQRYCADVAASSHHSLIHQYAISIRGSVDIGRLGNAVQQLFQQYDSLRLIFSSDATKQMVLHASDARILQRFQMVECENGDDELDDLVAKWHSSEQQSSDPPVAWLLLRSTDQIKILARIHHTVMDGTSMALIFRSLQETYETGGFAHPRTQFLPYLGAKRSPHLLESMAYWRGLLKDSKPTMLRKDAAALANNNGDVADLSAKRIVILPTILPANATYSTLIKSAWAIVLAKMTGRDDVLFYSLLNGRDETVPGSYEVVGCCATEVPMRIRISDIMTIASFLKQVQNQVLAALPHAHLGADTIARECASHWGEEITYRHSSFLIHQNIDVVEHFTLGDSAYVDVDEVVTEDTVVDFSITSSALGHGGLEVVVEASRHWYSQRELDAIADGLVRVMKEMSRDGHVPLERVVALAETIVL